jgi:ribonuclease HII
MPPRTAGGSCAGVDEAGRAVWPDRVFAAAVNLPRGISIPGLDDSHKLLKTSVRRRSSYHCAARRLLRVASASVGRSRRSTSRRTYLDMKGIAQLSPAAELALIDGNRSKGIVI